MEVEPMENVHIISASELAIMVREMREMRQWSQDTLSEISKLNIRTIQRVETGKPSSGDTRRALARAFELPDMDFFNKPVTIPSQEEIDKAKRELMSLPVHKVQSGQELTRLMEECTMHAASSVVELEGTAAEAFAGLVDYLRDYNDAADVMSETDKLGVFKDVQSYADALHSAGFFIGCGHRDAKLVGKNWPDKTPWEVKILYLVVYPNEADPKVMLVPRKVQLA